MADDTNPPPRTARRSSFAGQTFADLFGGSRPARPSNTDSQPSQQFPGPITSAAAQAQQRRLSIATLGLSGSPTNTTSPFGSLRGLATRRDSLSSANSGSLDESAIEDETSATTVGSVPTTPFARRMSFGARAMRDIRTSSGSAGGGGTSPGLQNGRSPPPVVSSKSGATTAQQHARVPSASASSTANNGTISARANGGRGEGFNWSDNLRSRAERTSIAAPSGIAAGNGSLGSAHHARAKSVATMEPPLREIPKPVANKPDHFQERILKGDFYMD